VAWVTIGAAAALLLGCASAPLGDDWDQLDRAGRDARALEALRELFAQRVDGAGAQVDDRTVVRCDRAGVVYETPGRPERRSKLRWSDITSVESRTRNDLPARPEALFLYVKGGSPSAEQVHDLTASPLVATGLVRPYLELKSRPRWSRNRFLAALQHLRKRRTAEVASVGSGSDVAPVASEAAAGETEAGGTQGELDDVEAKLRKLKEWHEQGLIDDADYEAKRKELLKDL
jgi:hypothetical protein